MKTMPSVELCPVGFFRLFLSEKGVYFIPVKKKTDDRLAAHIRRVSFLEEKYPYVIYDQNLVLRHVNEEFAKTLGYMPVELFGRSVKTVFKRPYGIPVRQYQKYLQEGSSASIKVILKTNPHDPYRLIEYPIEEEKGCAALVTVSRLDERYRFCLFTVNRFRMERTMGQQSLDSLVSLDRTGRVLAFSENFAWLSGRHLSNIFGKTVAPIFLPGTYREAEKGLYAARKTLLREERENAEPWELIYETRFKEPDWKKDWIFDRNLRLRITEEGLTFSSDVKCPFMTYQEPFALQEWDLCWEAELNSPGFAFFFNGAGRLRDSLIVTPDFTGYLLGLVYWYNSKRSVPMLKRNCVTLIDASPIANPGSRCRLRAEKSGGVTRLLLNNRKIFEYTDPHFVRYSRGAHTGLLLSNPSLVIRSLRLLRRRAHGDRTYSHPTCDLRFSGFPDEVFEAEFLPRRVERSDITDISLHRVTELRRAQTAVNALLNEKEENLRRIHKELALAGSVVERLVPREMPNLPGVTFEAHFKPSESVGGDLFDLIKLDDHRVVILMYDVSGHGVSAALISVMTRTLFQKTFVPDEPILPQLRAINTELCRTISATHFVAYFCAILDTGARTLRYVGGGIPYPAVVGGGRLMLLQSPGTPLGLRENLLAQEKCIPLKSRDKILLFTDGVYEIFDAAGEMYGRKRLMDFVSLHAHQSITELVQTLLKEHQRYLAGEPASDDVTLLGVEIT